ncbi:MAG: HAMP domain-containing histidine kinase [Magnetococcus sp. DMHC-1]
MTKAVGNHNIPGSTVTQESVSTMQKPNSNQNMDDIFIDLDSLGPRDKENICYELLSQMGFRGLDWNIKIPGIDMVAELPKRDPDGLQYKEMWLISLELRCKPVTLIEMVLREPELLFHHGHRQLTLFKETSYDFNTPVTLLFMDFHYNKHELDNYIEQINKYQKSKYKKSGLLLRTRIWDSNYLISLINKYPNILYKYFSEENRLRSETRKSYKELYEENIKLTNRQAILIRELENEKNQRIRAERDAVWKDIAFSAAHKIGNPIFAIETNLNPLQKRISEARTEEAIEIINNIQISVEKSKAFIEQFKSLSKAQEIRPLPIPLYPIFADACRIVSGQGVVCTIACPETILVKGDPDRLAECFDELAMNAAHWFDKKEKNLWFTVEEPAPDSLPRFLDSSGQYVLIQVRDNGCGILLADKELIFDAFVTRRPHGTGLGLALVRRIIEGHGGHISESGIPGEGSNFVLYLPLIVAPHQVDHGSMESC